MKILHKVITMFVLIPIYIYKFTLSPFLGRQCNYYPTCSSYAILAIKKYGVLKGIKMAVVRIYRCNPLNNEFKHDEP
jgi:putative membrane protein insertion efficiency factor